MIRVESRTVGLENMAAELLEETRKDALGPVARAGQRLAERMREKLSARGGPSRPGDPPAMEEGALRDSIGRTGPFSDPGRVQVAVGVGVGDEAARRVADWKSKGINVFEYADLHENGGTGADGRRYPPRSFARAAEAELEAEITADLERAL